MPSWRGSTEPPAIMPPPPITSVYIEEGLNGMRDEDEAMTSRDGGRIGLVQMGADESIGASATGGESRMAVTTSQGLPSPNHKRSACGARMRGQERRL